MTYYDDPQANIPTVAYSWIVNRGGPYFLKQVHQAAKKLEKRSCSKENVVRITQTSSETTKDQENTTVDMSGSIPNYQTA